MTTLSGYTDPPPPPEGHTLEVQRDPFLGFITHYRHTENAMQEKIGTDLIGHGSIQGTEEERRAQLRVMGAGMVKGEWNALAEFRSAAECARRGYRHVVGDPKGRISTVGKHEAVNHEHLRRIYEEAKDAFPRFADTLAWMLWHDILRFDRLTNLAENFGVVVSTNTRELDRLRAEVEILLQGKNNWAARAEKAEAERDALQARVAEAEAESEGAVMIIAQERAENLNLKASVAELKAELAREEKVHEITIRQRDRAEDAADKLAYSIGGDLIGEHSSVNDPWANALHITEGKAALAELEAERDGAYNYALRLSHSLRERLFPDNTDWEPLGDLFGLLTQIDNMSTAIPSALAAQGAVTVKPLAWERAHVANPDVHMEASDASGLHYEVFSGGGWAINGKYMHPRMGERTLEAAKAAAQADYERRILAALTTAQKEGGV